MPDNPATALPPSELIANMNSAYQDFLAACQSFEPQKAALSGACGDWSAKSVVDHLIGWQVQSLSILDALTKGRSDAFDFDIDAFNAASVENRKDTSWQESLQDLQDSFADFKKALEKIKAAQFQTNKGFAAWIKAMIHEYEHHLSHVRSNTK